MQRTKGKLTHICRHILLPPLYSRVKTKSADVHGSKRANETNVISRPMFSCQSNLLCQLIVRSLAIWSASEESEDVVHVGVINLYGNVAGFETGMISIALSKVGGKGAGNSLDPRLNSISVPFGEESRFENACFHRHQSMEST